MTRKTKLITLGCVLVAAIGVTVGVGLSESEKEAISESGEVVFELPADDATALSWQYDDDGSEVSLAFHKDGDWLYDEDEAFPVDGEKIEELLDVFSELSAAFVIEDVTDYDQYGLENPLCTIDITAGDTDYEILIGNYSELDYQRYVSVGYGKVYLVNDDPMDYYKTTLDELMKDDELPSFVDVTQVSFTGAQDYTIERDEDGSSYLEDDVYYTDGEPLDPDKVNSYVTYISALELGEYYTYNAGDEEIADCGLDEPELTVYIEYPDSDTEETHGFTISFSRSASDKLTDWDEVLADMEAEEAAAESGETEETEEPSDDDAVAYMRIGESQIIYEIDYDSFTRIMECAYDDLRHSEVFPAEFENVQSLTVSLGGEEYAFTRSEDEDGEEQWYYGETEAGVSDIESALTGLGVTSFTSERASGTEEISLTAVLDLEGNPEVSVALYRVDGESCLAVVDGVSVGYVPRSQVVSLIEAVNAIVLN